MKVYLGNAFSGQMIRGNALIRKESVAPQDIPVDAISCIGHPDLAAVVSDVLGREVAAARVNISLEAGDVLYVAQLVGGRLPEGSTSLPEGFSLAWDKYSILE